jgi:hypothetical protein
VRYLRRAKNASGMSRTNSKWPPGTRTMIIARAIPIARPRMAGCAFYGGGVWTCSALEATAVEAKVAPRYAKVSTWKPRALGSECRDLPLPILLLTASVYTSGLYYLKRVKGAKGRRSAPK